MSHCKKVSDVMSHHITDIMILVEFQLSKVISLRSMYWIMIKLGQIWYINSAFAIESHSRKIIELAIVRGKNFLIFPSYCIYIWFSSNYLRFRLMLYYWFYFRKIHGWNMKTLVLLAIYSLLESDVRKVESLETLMDRAWRSEWCNEEQFGANHTMCIYQEGMQKHIL